jgi:hypothetical protein
MEEKTADNRALFPEVPDSDDVDGASEVWIHFCQRFCIDPEFSSTFLTMLGLSWLLFVGRSHAIGCGRKRIRKWKTEATGRSSTSIITISRLFVDLTCSGKQGVREIGISTTNCFYFIVIVDFFNEIH